MNTQEYVILVDEQDNEIGIAEKLEAHQLGKLHRAFSVFVIRQRHGKLQILLQQRQHDKYHSPGLWTNTCCSHPMPGEPVAQAAHRRLQQEMGIDVNLHEIACFHYTADVGAGLIENEVDHVFVGQFEDDYVPFNVKEVANYQWMDADKLVTDLKENPQKYTAWFEEALILVLQKPR